MKLSLRRTESLSAAVMMISWMIINFSLQVFSTLSIVISANKASGSSADVANVLIGNLTTFAMNCGSVILLVVAMFRGKRDLFAGIAFTVNAFFPAITVISNILQGSFAYAQLVTAVFFAILAVDCFLNGVLAKYSWAVALVSVLVGVLNIVQSIQFVKLITQPLADNPGMMLTTMLPMLLFRLVDVSLYVAYILIAVSMMPEKTVQVAYADGSVRNIPVSATRDNGFFGMTAHVLLLLFSGILWSAIWVYRTAKYLNKTPEESTVNPLVQTILYCIVPFYSIYLFYQMGKRTDKLGQSCGINSSDVMACLLLGIFLPFAAMLLIQSRVNNISKACAAPVM